MRRVESYAALTPLLSAQLRRGVVTNCFLSPADYQREIDAGLFYEEGDGFLLLLRQRAGHPVAQLPDQFLRGPVPRLGTALCVDVRRHLLAQGRLACRVGGSRSSRSWPAGKRIKLPCAGRRTRCARSALPRRFAVCGVRGRQFLSRIPLRLRQRLHLRLCGRFYLNSSTR